jgi:hypothetical protein
VLLLQLMQQGWQLVLHLLLPQHLQQLLCLRYLSARGVSSTLALAVLLVSCPLRCVSRRHEAWFGHALLQISWKYWQPNVETKT